MLVHCYYSLGLTLSEASGCCSQFPKLWLESPGEVLVVVPTEETPYPWLEWVLTQLLSKYVGERDP